MSCSAWTCIGDAINPDSFIDRKLTAHPGSLHDLSETGETTTSVGTLAGGFRLTESYRVNIEMANPLNSNAPRSPQECFVSCATMPR